MFVADWIFCTTSSTGTGNLTLATKSGWFTFTDHFAAGDDGACDYFDYVIRDSTTLIPKEAGFGHMSNSTTFVRDHVYMTNSSGTISKANTPISLTGTNDVICADLASTRLRGTMNIRTGATNRYIGDTEFRSATGNFKSLNAGTLYAIPFRIDSPALISGAGFHVTTLAAASNARVGLYRLKKDREPGDIICQTGDIATTTIGFKSGSWSAGGDRRLPAGDYILAIKSNGGNPQVYAGEAAARVLPDSHWLGGNGSANTIRYTFGSASDAGSALSTTCPALSWTGAVVDYAPRVYLIPTAY
jgi:hypothetical protein